LNKFAIKLVNSLKSRFSVGLRGEPVEVYSQIGL
jgi:hypothetical protein